MTDVVPNWTVTSFLTTISGRGVAQGSVNIQPISSRSRNVVMHELGHSHGYMGDEYDSGGERTFAEWFLMRNSQAMVLTSGNPGSYFSQSAIELRTLKSDRLKMTSSNICKLNHCFITF